MTLLATYFGSSSWLIELDNFRILIDPWLRGDLFFAPGPWLIHGKLQRTFDIPKSIDLLLLTQGLPDHSHIPSLELLNRSIPVIGSKGAIKVVDSLGFLSTHELNPGKSEIIDEISIQATAGAKVPILENGYIVTNKNYSFYIEPHGFLDQTIESTHIDLVFTPVVDLKLPLAGSFIQGASVLPRLLRTFTPNFVLASTTGGDVAFSGLLNNLISAKGTNTEASRLIGDNSRFIDPLVGKTYHLGN